MVVVIVKFVIQVNVVVVVVKFVKHDPKSIGNKWHGLWVPSDHCGGHGDERAEGGRDERGGARSGGRVGACAGGCGGGRGDGRGGGRGGSRREVRKT